MRTSHHTSQTHRRQSPLVFSRAVFVLLLWQSWIGGHHPRCHCARPPVWVFVADFSYWQTESQFVCRAITCGSRCWWLFQHLLGSDWGFVSDKHRNARWLIHTIAQKRSLWKFFLLITKRECRTPIEWYHLDCRWQTTRIALEPFSVTTKHLFSVPTLPKYSSS